MAARRPRGRSGRARQIDIWDLQSQSGSVLERVEKAYLAALAAIDEHEQRLTEARASMKFTEAGLVDDALSHAATKLMPRLQRERLAVVQAKSAATSLRRMMTLPVDKTDTYGLQRRAELRTWLRTLPEAGRHAIGANLAAADPELQLAVAEMPSAAERNARNRPRPDH